MVKRKVLFVDDDESIRDLFRIIFERAGYEIVIESDSHNILEDNYDLPDIFLLDRQLSGPDGLITCNYIKTSPKTRDIPVILISASPDIKALSRSAGADGFIEKPFNIDDLLKTVDMHLLKIVSSP